MNEQLLGLLACPICKGPLQLNREATELSCPVDRRVYAVRDGVPILVAAEGRPWVPDEAIAAARPDQPDA